jgi:serine phosphatase RsbU (regulator of sigma subunit)
VLGLFAQWTCTIEERQLNPGDVLALYTDGVTEAFNKRGDEYGEARLLEALQKKRHLPPQALLAEIVEDVQKFGGRDQHDDITLMVARCP